MEAYAKQTNMGKIMESSKKKLDKKDLLNLTVKDDKAHLAIFQECQNKLQVHCEWCGGFGHVYKHCRVRKEMTRQLREYGYKKQWGDAKKEFWQKMIDTKANLAEKARDDYKVNFFHLLISKKYTQAQMSPLSKAEEQRLDIIINLDKAQTFEHTTMAESSLTKRGDQKFSIDSNDNEEFEIDISKVRNAYESAEKHLYMKQNASATWEHKTKGSKKS